MPTSFGSLVNMLRPWITERRASSVSTQAIASVLLIRFLPWQSAEEVVPLCSHHITQVGYNKSLAMSDSYNPQSEAEIVWLDKSTSALNRYAQEIIVKSGQRANRPKTSYNMIAYATLRADAKSVRRGEFLRRIWYVSDHNPNGNPMEGIDPKTIAAGKWSLQWGCTNTEDTYVPS
jgi:hypothetical protein